MPKILDTISQNKNISDYKTQQQILVPEVSLNHGANVSFQVTNDANFSFFIHLKDHFGI